VGLKHLGSVVRNLVTWSVSRICQLQPVPFRATRVHTSAARIMQDVSPRVQRAPEWSPCVAFPGMALIFPGFAALAAGSMADSSPPLGEAMRLRVASPAVRLPGHGATCFIADSAVGPTWPCIAGEKREPVLNDSLAKRGPILTRTPLSDVRFSGHSAKGVKRAGRSKPNIQPVVDTRGTRAAVFRLGAGSLAVAGRWYTPTWPGTGFIGGAPFRRFRRRDKRPQSEGKDHRSRRSHQILSLSAVRAQQHRHRFPL